MVWWSLNFEIDFDFDLNLDLGIRFSAIEKGEMKKTSVCIVMRNKMAARVITNLIWIRPDKKEQHIELVRNDNNDPKSPFHL